MRKILKMLKPYRLTLVLAILFSAMYAILEIALPIFTKKIMSEGIIQKNMNNIIHYGFLMLGITLLGVITSILNTYFSTKTSVNYAMHIRNNVFTKVSHLSHSDVDKIGVSSMMTRTTNDVRQVHDFILNTLKSILPVPIMLVGGFVMAYSVNRNMLRIILMVIPVLLVIVLVVLIFIMPMFAKIQKLLDKVNFILRGKISGIRVIRAFNKMDYEDSRFDETNNKLTRMSLKAARIMSSFLPILTVGAYSLIVYIIYICVTDAARPGTPTDQALEIIPNMYMFLSYFTMIIGAITTAVTIFIAWPKANVSAKRVSEILDAVPDIVEPENPVSPDAGSRGRVTFDNVTFTYPPEPEDPKAKKKRLRKERAEKRKAEKEGKEYIPPEPEPTVPAISNISFDMKAGETTAIIGITGCGKSTLVNLIPRLYDVTEGSVSIDNVDVRNMSLDELHRHVAYVPQQSYLFSGTIRDNITFGMPEATDDQVWQAIEIAQAKAFVSELPDGLDSFVSQAGKNFSGGQKQRLAIARAIVKRPEICILDDSFSALDLATDARLRAALRESMPETSFLIVAQRVGTVINADRIIVMDQGEAVGIGTHDELLNTCPIYREIVASQLSGEEYEDEIEDDVPDTGLSEEVGNDASDL